MKTFNAYVILTLPDDAPRCNAKDVQADLREALRDSLPERWRFTIEAVMLEATRPMEST